MWSKRHFIKLTANWTCWTNISTTVSMIPALSITLAVGRSAQALWSIITTCSIASSCTWAYHCTNASWTEVLKIEATVTKEGASIVAEAPCTPSASTTISATCSVTSSCTWSTRARHICIRAAISLQIAGCITAAGWRTSGTVASDTTVLVSSISTWANSSWWR